MKARSPFFVARYLTPPRTSGLLSMAAWLGLAACGGEKIEASSVLLITLDTTRADILGCYEGAVGTTPNLERLAAESIVYDAAHTVSPVTVPSHTSMLTGLYPLRHSVRSNDMHGLPKEALTLAELAGEHDIQTAALVAAVALDSRYGLDQGFDTYGEPKTWSSPSGRVTRQFPATHVVDEAIRWLDERDDERRFFLWVHLFDPHQPYSPPQEFRGGVYAGDPYLGEIGFLDREVGRLIDRLKVEELLSSTTVLVVADHGEGLGDHGEATHGVLCYEETIRVPLLLRYPDGHRSGERSSEIVSVVDVFPTLADAMQLPVPPGLDGHSLYRSTVPSDRGIYFEAYEGYLAFGYSPLAGWMDARGKYIHGSTPLLFDLTQDPGETTDLSSERPDLVKEYRSQISKLAAKEAFTPVTGASMDEETLNELRKLGYAGVGSSDLAIPHPLAPSDRPAASTVMHLHHDTTRGMDLFLTGELEEAEELLARAADALPHSATALFYLGRCRMKQGKHAEAIVPFRRLTQERPDMASAHFNLGRCFRATGRLDDALVPLKEAVRLDPTQGNYYAVLVPLLAKLGRLDEARSYDDQAKAAGLK